MKYRILLFSLLAVIVTDCTQAMAADADSLTHYLQVAARNNPQVRADFNMYRASLEKIPQAGAFEDPELEMGFYIRPMETLMGKQVADFTLMQMFPWFGTRKAARSEAAEMARMEHEKFRASRDELWYNVKSQWYRLVTLNEQYRTTQANIRLLEQLERLALNRFSAAGTQGGAALQPAMPTSAQPGESMPSASASTSSGSMSGMGGMGGGNTTITGGNTKGMAGSSGMAGMSGNMNAPAGGMSDVLRIRLERASLEDEATGLLASRRVEEAAFNALLNRDARAKLSIPDSLQQLLFAAEESVMLDSIFVHNPMLTMLDAEKASYEAMAKMQRRMSYPMIGIGLQYSPLKAMPSQGMSADNGGTMRMGEGIDMESMNGQDMIMPMLKISLPLFRRKYNARQREYKSYMLASDLKREDARNRLHVDYLKARKELDDASRRVKLYERQQMLTETVWQLIVQEFAAGKQPLSEVIQVERQLLDYRLKRSEAIAAYNTAVASIEKLVSTTLITESK